MGEDETAKRLMDRWDGWRIWYGVQTDRWWAMPPRGLDPAVLLSAATAGDLATRILAADPRGAQRGDPHGDPPLRAGWRLDGVSWPVRVARRNTAEALLRWHCESWRDDALTVVSELVTNAVAYGSPPITLSLWLLETDRPRLQIDVSDGSAALPVRREPGDRGGYGLSILEGYARLSLHPQPTGKIVRAVLER